MKYIAVMDYKKGYELTMTNAKALMQVSEQAAESKNYGTACSLNVLAAEEAIKAFYLLVRQYYPKIELKDFEDFFRFHKAKHIGLVKFLTIPKRIQIKFDLLFKKYSGKRYEDVLKVLRALYELPWNAVKAKAIKNWLQDANDKKNNGLYVNKKDSKWITPQDIKLETYTMEVEYTKSILAYTERLGNYLIEYKV